jgi:hypothetical protein
MWTVLLTSTLILPALADPAEPANSLEVSVAVVASPAASPAQPSLAVTAALPDRWFVMRELQGTYFGDVLDTNRITISGWDEVSYTVSSDRRDNLPEGFDYRAQHFLLQENWLRIDCPVVQTGTTEPTFGFHSDTILGSDYRFTLARGLFSGQLTADNGGPDLYGIDPVQFYAEAYIPTVGQGLDIKFGRWFAQFGVESIDTTLNPLASHSYAFIYDPFTHTGLLTTLKLTDTWSIQNGLVTGSDVFIDPAARLTYVGGIKWAPPSGSDSILFEAIVGPGVYETSRQFNNPDIFDLVYVHKFDKVLTYSLEILYGFEGSVPAIGFANWVGCVNYLTYQMTPKLSATGRLGFFDDEQGQRTGFEGLYTAVTGGLNYQPIKDLTFRPEIRCDYNSDSRPYEGKHGLFTADFDVIVRW